MFESFQRRRAEEAAGAMSASCRKRRAGAAAELYLFDGAGTSHGIWSDADTAQLSDRRLRSDLERRILAFLSNLEKPVEKPA